MFSLLARPAAENIHSQSRPSFVEFRTRSSQDLHQPPRVGGHALRRPAGPSDVVSECVMRALFN